MVLNWLNWKVHGQTSLSKMTFKWPNLWIRLFICTFWQVNMNLSNYMYYRYRYMYWDMFSWIEKPKLLICVKDWRQLIMFVFMLPNVHLGKLIQFCKHSSRESSSFISWQNYVAWLFVALLSLSFIHQQGSTTASNQTQTCHVKYE